MTSWSVFGLFVEQAVRLEVVDPWLVVAVYDLWRRTSGSDLAVHDEVHAHRRIAACLAQPLEQFLRRPHRLLCLRWWYSYLVSSLFIVGWYALSKVYAYDDMKQKCAALVRRERECAALVRRERETSTYVDDVYVSGEMASWGRANSAANLGEMSSSRWLSNPARRNLFLGQ